MQNRIIKFRAWDGKRMTTSGIMFNTSTGCLEVPTVGSFGSEMVTPYFLMQFTGLKDKNGVEIYQGDIVTDSLNRMENIDVIDWGDCGWSTKDSEKWEYKGFDEIALGGRFEVIGNIHQNPELLVKN